MSIIHNTPHILNTIWKMVKSIFGKIWNIWLFKVNWACLLSAQNC